MNLENKIHIIFLTLVVVFVFLLVGRMDHQDEQMMLADYCDQVESEEIPNYKNIECGE